MSEIENNGVVEAPAIPNSSFDATILESNNGGKGMAIASLVLGIISVVLCCAWYLALPCAVVAVVLAIVIFVSKKPGKNFAIAGLVLGIVGLVLVIGLLIFGAIGAGILSQYPEFSDFYNQYNSIW